MKIYFIQHDGKQLGPFDKLELIEMKLSKTTAIWYEPLEDWTIIEKVKELKDIFMITPPPFNAKKIEVEDQNQIIDNNKEENKLPPIPKPGKLIEEDLENKFKMKNIFYAATIIILVAVIYFVYAAKNSDQIIENGKGIQSDNNEVVNQNKDILSTPEKIAPKSADKIRDELRIKEQNSPLDYLTIQASINENKVQTRNPTMFRRSKYKIDGYILNGTISNIATLAVFKDIEIKVTFISKTGTKISSEKFFVYDNSFPNNNVNFEHKIYPPDGTSNFEYKIISASVF
jgi:hypothetical protein